MAGTYYCNLRGINLFTFLLLASVGSWAGAADEPAGVSPGADPPVTPAVVTAEPTAAAPDVAALASAAALAGHNSWMLTSSALVLFMTAPGLAMFYGGLVRKKNVLGVMMQCIFLMALMTVIWALWGYSLCFGGGSDNPCDRKRRVPVHE